MAKLAFLGTGLIGSSLAEAAARRGDEVRAWNRTRSKAERLGAFGVRVVDSPEDAVRGADRVHVAFTDDAAVDATLAACGSALGTAVIVDHSTASPRGTAARAASLEKSGIAYLHCPVFMSPEMCRNAAGIMLAAGPRPLPVRGQGSPNSPANHGRRALGYARDQSSRSRARTRVATSVKSPKPPASTLIRPS